MNSLIHKHVFFMLACLLTIGIHGQKKVTEERSFSNKKSFNDRIISTWPLPSKMPIDNPNYELDKQINQTLINDTEPVIMPIYKPYLSLEFKPASLAKTNLKTIEEIKKSLGIDDDKS